MKQFRDTPYYVTECGKVFRNGKERSFTLSNKGYKDVGLWISNKRKHEYIHRMVAELYIPNPDNKPCVNHIDGNKLNNHYFNIEWVTLKENSQHSVNVLGKEVRENHRQAKIPNRIVSYIHQCKKVEVIPKYDKICKNYDVKVSYLKHIYNGHKRKLG